MTLSQAVHSSSYFLHFSFHCSVLSGAIFPCLAEFHISNQFDFLCDKGHLTQQIPTSVWSNPPPYENMQNKFAFLGLFAAGVLALGFSLFFNRCSSSYCIYFTQQNVSKYINIHTQTTYVVSANLNLILFCLMEHAHLETWTLILKTV